MPSLHRSPWTWWPHRAAGGLLVHETEEIPDHDDVEPAGEYEEPDNPTETEDHPREDITVTSSASTRSESITVVVDVTNVSETKIDIVETQISFSESGHRLDTLIRTIKGLRPSETGTVSAQAGFAYLGGVPDECTVETRPMDVAE